jgi:hypothetical protein
MYEKFAEEYAAHAADGAYNAFVRPAGDAGAGR